jgi:pyruvate/2-oxoglutarate dehydrogenase complex dihydrolipoamide dehydrogenase (E3) component
MSEHYDAIIVGSGQAGNPLARALAQAGRRTVLVERDQVGGTCINTGCTPTKTLVASARVAHLARRAADYGLHVGPVGVEMARVRERKRAIVASFRDGSERRLDSAGVQLVRGEARFTGPRELSVQLRDGSHHTLHADLIVINTGTRSSIPDLPGLAAVPFLDSASIQELDRVPAHLLVLGGGYIGLEFGQMFRRFGSAVTIVQRGPTLLGREDPDMADAVAEVLRDDGIEVLLNTAARTVTQAHDGTIVLGVDGPEGARDLRGSHLLVAVGRRPNTDALDLPTGGIAADTRGFISVDARLQTSVPGVYAVGDVTGGPAFTHSSYDDYRVLERNLLHGGEATTDGRLVPYTMFIDPQFARVGLSEQEAREQGRAVKVATMPMSYVARALEVGEARGLMKAVVEAESGQIVGFACLGIEGGELMAMVQVAMLGRLPYTVLRDAIFAHPTLAEALNNLFSSLEG